MTPCRDALDVLYVGDLPPYRTGTAIVGVQLLSGLAKLGHSVRALAPITTQALGAGNQFAARHPEIGVARFPVPSLDDLPSDVHLTADGWSAECDGIAAGFRVLIAGARPNVVIVGKERYLWSTPDLTKASGLPSVLLVQSTRPLRILNRSPARATAQAMLAQYRKVDGIVFVAAHLAEPARRLGLRNLKVILNGVDLQRFSARPKDATLLRHLHIRDDRVIVVHVSNLKEVKRPLDIVGSAGQVLRRDPEIVYVIVGDGPCRATMEERCRRKGILESFRFVGWAEHERIPAYLNLADIVVMPSEDEALALVYLEAQACGRLLLASDIPAAREVVRDGQTGLLFGKGDVDELAAQTLRAAGDADLRAATGRRAREWVRIHHDLDRTVTAHEHALREAARRPRH